MIDQTGTILKGTFLEFCDCYTICPCWVNESPDEDHCSALYVWRFEEGAEIEGFSIEGTAMAIAAFHAKKQTTQSAVFLDERMADQPREILRGLVEAAADKRDEGDDVPLLDGLARLLGSIVQISTARIELSSPAENNGAAGIWKLTLSYDQATLAEAHYKNAYMKAIRKGKNDNQPLEPRSNPLSLKDTALHDELSLQSDAVVQEVDRFDLSVPSLPGAPFSYAGRSGMSSWFDYSKKG